MADLVVLFLALPIGLNDANTFFPDESSLIQCASAEDAIAAAGDLAAEPCYVGSVAYRHVVDPVTGLYEIETLRRFARDPELDCR